MNFWVEFKCIFSIFVYIKIFNYIEYVRLISRPFLHSSLSTTCKVWNISPKFIACNKLLKTEFEFIFEDEKIFLIFMDIESFKQIKRWPTMNWQILSAILQPKLYKIQNGGFFIMTANSIGKTFKEAKWKD